MCVGETERYVKVRSHLRRRVSRKDAKIRQDAKANRPFVACIKTAFRVCYLSATTSEVEPCFDALRFYS
jgi:hypothetical protein